MPEAIATDTAFYLQGNFAPVQHEISASGLKIRGDWPRALNGTLYRNGPNPQFPDPLSHWFVGDGMIHAITVQDRAAAYLNRWVRTPKFLAERRAGQKLFSGFGTKLPDAPDGAGDDSGVANTHVIWHGGRLLALEEAHLPTELDPRSLETRGYQDYGALAAPVTAHPKIDPHTGEMLFFGYNADGRLTTGLSFGIVDAAGTLRRYERFAAPYAAMVHDFMITEHHVLFPILPLTGSQQRAMRGRPPYAWEPDKGACIGVMRRDGATDGITWFRGEACYAFHMMNAWEEGGAIVAEAMVYPEPPLFPHADGSPSDPARQQARLTRWRFDPAAGTDRFAATPVDELTGEFPRIDERWTGRAQRHGWYASDRADAAAGGYGGLVHRDGLAGQSRAWWLPPGDAVSEPVFAPRGAAEGDGWLLAIAWRAAEARSELLLFEATDLAAGPIAAIELPQRIPFGFHGSWVAADALA